MYKKTVDTLRNAHKTADLVDRTHVYSEDPTFMTDIEGKKYEMAISAEIDKFNRLKKLK